MSSLVKRMLVPALFPPACIDVRPPAMPIADMLA
jgi:hypothetical protein